MYARTFPHLSFLLFSMMHLSHSVGQTGFRLVLKLASKVKSLSRVQLFVTPRTVAYQASPSVGFSKQEYWSGLPFPSPSNIHSPLSNRLTETREIKMNFELQMILPQLPFIRSKILRLYWEVALLPWVAVDESEEAS